MSETSTSENVASIRAELEASFGAARERVSKRLAGGHGAASRSARSQARELLKQSRQRARRLLGEEVSTELAPATEATPLSVHDLHTLERLASYVRHSVVRVCFYNLKLFCPSLVDEYDAHVKEQVVTNVDQIEAARDEIEQFFEQTLSNGQRIADVWPRIHGQAVDRLDALTALARSARNQLDDVSVRTKFAERAPGLIDDTMAALQAVQTELDARKFAVGEPVQDAVQLAANAAAEAGLTIRCDIQPTPKVFGNRPHLLNAFSELIMNAAKHSGGTAVEVGLARAPDAEQRVRIAFVDDGRGMTPEECAACVNRGVTTGGSGEGLPMVVGIVEEEHLGELRISGEPGKGCCFEVILPVKLNTRKEQP